MVSILLGALSAALVIAAFVSGILVTKKITKNVFVPEPMTQEEAEKNAKKRRELQEQQQAFQQMQTYSAETAYGMTRNDGIGGHDR